MGRSCRWAMLSATFTMLNLTAPSEGATLSLTDAMHLAQSFALEASVISITQLEGPAVTYNYGGTQAPAGWDSVLSGGTISLTYTGDATKYDTQGHIVWTSTGWAAGKAVNEAGIVNFTPGATGVVFDLSTQATHGMTSLGFTLTGTVELDAGGALISIPHAQTGRLVIDGILMADSYSIWGPPKTKGVYDDKNGVWNTVQAIEEPSDGVITGYFMFDPEGVAVPEPSSGSLVLMATCLFRYLLKPLRRERPIRSFRLHVP